MAYESNIGPYPARSEQFAAGWTANIGVDQEDLSGAGAPYWDMPDAKTVNRFVGTAFTLDIAEHGVASTYQWYKNYVSMGASYQNRVLAIASPVTTDGGSYRCVATNGLGTSTTYPVALYVRPVLVNTPVALASNRGVYPAKTDEGAAGWSENIGPCTSDLFGAGAPYWGSASMTSVWIYEGEEVLVDMPEGGVASTYQWYVDGISMGAAHQNRVLSIPGALSTDGGMYYCVATNGFGSSTSPTVTWYVRPWPVVSSYSANRGPFTARSPELVFTTNIGPLPGQQEDVPPTGTGNVVTLAPQWVF